MWHDRLIVGLHRRHLRSARRRRRRRRRRRARKPALMRRMLSRVLMRMAWLLLPGRQAMLTRLEALRMRRQTTCSPQLKLAHRVLCSLNLLAQQTRFRLQTSHRRRLEAWLQHLGQVIFGNLSLKLWQQLSPACNQLHGSCCVSSTRYGSRTIVLVDHDDQSNNDADV